MQINSGGSSKPDNYLDRLMGRFKSLGEVDYNAVGNNVGDSLANATRGLFAVASGKKIASVEEEREVFQQQGKNFLGSKVGTPPTPMDDLPNDDFLMTVLLFVIGGIALIKFLD